MRETSLSESDRTVFAKCPKCCRTGKGTLAPNFYSMAYTKRQWKRSPTCENCGTVMKYLYEVETDDSE